MPLQVISYKDWLILTEEANQHKLAPFLLWIIDNDDHSLPYSAYESLAKAYLQAVSRFMILENSQLTITRVLNDAGIPHIWLKGIALAATIYPNGALRPMADLDVLVDFDHCEKALICLLDVGYSFTEENALFDANELAQHNRSHHYVLSGGPAAIVKVELHFRLLSLQSWRFLPIQQQQWFKKQTIHYYVGSERMTTLAPEAHLLYLCAHIMVQHSIQDYIVTRLLDLHLLIKTYQLDWKLILNKAVELRWTYIVEQPLRQTQSLFDTDIPVPIFEALSNWRSIDEDTHNVKVLNQPGSIFERAWQTLLHLSRKERVDWISQVIFPKKEYMQARYSITDMRFIYVYYIYRWNSQLIEALKWICAKIFQFKS